MTLLTYNIYPEDTMVRDKMEAINVTIETSETGSTPESAIDVWHEGYYKMKQQRYNNLLWPLALKLVSDLHFKTITISFLTYCGK